MSGVFDAVGDAVGDVVDFAGDIISDLGPVLPIAAAVFTGGAAAGLWGAAGAAGAAAGTTAAGMLSAETASLLAAGFTEAEVAASLAGLGSSAEIASILTGAGIGATEAASLANTALSVGDTGSGLFGTNDAAASWFNPDGSLNVDAYVAATGDPFATTAGVNAGWNPTTGYGLNSGYSSGTLDTLYNQLKSTGLDSTDALKAANSIMKGGATSGLLSGGLTALGGYLQGTAGQDAATKAAAAQIQAAQVAADAAKFRPVGVTTRFGQSQFQKDAQGNVIGAGYALTPDVKAQQDALMGISNTMLGQYGAGQVAALPMGQAAQTMMTLGNNYLATTPEQQAQKYMAEQQALLATGRERDMNQMLTGEFNRGTYGLSTGGTSTGMMGANPRLEALYNAQRQQDLGLASQATQGGMDYAKFGAGMVGGGGDMLKSMYGVQSAAYDPYKTAMGGAQTLEGLGQNAMDLGVNLGKVTSNAQAGQLLGQGMLTASQTMQPADAYSPWGAMLTGAGNTMQNYAQQQPQQQYQFNPFTGVRL